MRGKYRPGPILNIFVANQLATQLAAREFERAGLEARWVAILHLIWLHEPVTPTELEQLSGMPSTTLRDYVNELVDRGEVRRVANPADGRSQLLELTPAGERLADETRLAFQHAWKRIEKHLGRPLKDFDPPVEALIRGLRAALSDD